MDSINKFFPMCSSMPQWLYVILFLALCISIWVIFTRKESIRIKVKRMLGVMFTEYLVVLLCFTIFLRKESENHVIRYEFFHDYLVNNMLLLKDALMNIAIFVPVGFCSSVFLKHPKWVKILLISGILSCSIEFSQYILSRGYCDANDIMNNCIGGLLGWLVVACFRANNKPPLIPLHRGNGRG